MEEVEVPESIDSNSKGCKESSDAKRLAIHKLERRIEHGILVLDDQDK